MISSNRFFNQFKGVSVNADNSEKWKYDEKLILNNSCKFDVQFLGSVEIDDPGDLSKCCSVLKDMIGKRKLIKGVVNVSPYSLTFYEKATMDLKVDQTLKDIVLCSNHPGIPYTFFYTNREPILNAYQLFGFISMKEVSDRIVNAISFAVKIYSEKITQSTNYISDMKKSQGVDQNKFKQTSLVERYQDPQSSIVICESKLSNSKTFTDLKSIPRPKSYKKSTSELFPNLNPNDLFKNCLTDSLENKHSKSEYSSKDDLANIFMTNFDETLSLEDKLNNVYQINQRVHQEKVLTEARKNDTSSFAANDSSQISKYDIFKTSSTPLSSTGWSKELTGNECSAQITTKKPSSDFDEFLSIFLENINSTNIKDGKK